MVAEKPQYPEKPRRLKEPVMTEAYPDPYPAEAVSADEVLFDVFVKHLVGSVHYDPKSRHTPEQAAFLMIEKHVATTLEGGEFTFTSGGITVHVDVTLDK